jgi:hypothetical protein
MEPLMLIVEKSQGELWGRVHYEDDLLIDSARSIEGLERKMKKLLKDLHGVDPRNIVFEYQYDLTALFEKFNYLKISAIADKSELNAALLRQYVTGIKHPSAKQAKKVESAIHKIGRELSKIAVYAECILIIATVLRWLF